MNLPRSVLLIEDQHDIAANIWDFLERRGYRIDHAADGEAGLAAALRGRFDVIVLDLGLPRRSRKSQMLAAISCWSSISNTLRG